MLVKNMHCDEEGKFEVDNELINNIISEEWGSMCVSKEKILWAIEELLKKEKIEKLEGNYYKISNY